MASAFDDGLYDLLSVKNEKINIRMNEKNGFFLTNSTRTNLKYTIPRIILKLHMQGDSYSPHGEGGTHIKVSGDYTSSYPIYIHCNPLVWMVEAKGGYQICDGISRS